MPARTMVILIRAVDAIGEELEVPLRNSLPDGVVIRSSSVRAMLNHPSSMCDVEPDRGLVQVGLPLRALVDSFAVAGYDPVVAIGAFSVDFTNSFVVSAGHQVRSASIYKDQTALAQQLQSKTGRDKHSLSGASDFLTGRRRRRRFESTTHESAIQQNRQICATRYATHVELDSSGQRAEEVVRALLKRLSRFDGVRRHSGDDHES